MRNPSIGSGVPCMVVPSVIAVPALSCGGITTTSLPIVSQLAQRAGTAMVGWTG
jgi:hypothetical protein